MAEPVTPGALEVFRELLQEFRGVGNALGEVVERTARLETKVDRLTIDQAATLGMQNRIAELENWFRAETAARNTRGNIRAIWITAIATLAGGAVGSIITHVWK